MSKHLLFVYGTLRQGGVNAMLDLYPDTSFRGNAVVNGQLYDLGDYPALLLDNSACPVIGEVYEINDEILRSLDEFEVSAQYSRNQVDVLLDGQTTSCWLYGPSADLCSGKYLIESGDWIEYAKTKNLTKTE